MDGWMGGCSPRVDELPTPAGKALRTNSSQEAGSQLSRTRGGGGR